MSINKMILIVSAGLTILSCSENQDEPKPEALEESTTYYSWIKDLFEEITIDKFHVFSSRIADSDNYKFKGEIMNGEHLMAFPEKCWNPSTERTIYSACYKFKIDENRMGLIIRAPGDYEQTKIQLALFNFNLDRVTSLVDLADFLNKESETLDYSSFIFKDENENFQVLKYTHTTTQENDGVDYTDNHQYELFDLSNKWMDTISIDSAYIVSNYPNMVKQLTGL